MSKKKNGDGSRSQHSVQPEDLLRFVQAADPQISPSGATVLFTRKHVGKKNDYVSNLWTVASGGGEPQQFTAGEKDSHGRWSPDGRTVAFISKREKPRQQIFIMPAGGGEATAFTRFPEGSIGSFRWSPDGQSLAVAYRETAPEWTDEAKQEREKNGGSIPPRVIDQLYYRLDGDGYFNERRFALYIVEVASGEHRLVFDQATLGDFHYDWSPDSAELIVSANTHPDALLKAWKDELFKVDAKSGKVRKMKHVPAGHKGLVRWSPDGRWIAFAGREGKEIWGCNNTRLYVCDSESGQTRDLTGHQDYCLTATTLSDSAEAVFGANFLWSPDSQRIVLQIGWHGETRIASLPVSGGDLTFHTSGRQTVVLGNISSDGSRLAVLRGDPTSLPDVSVCDAGVLPDSKASAAAPAPWTVHPLTSFNADILAGLTIEEPESHWIQAEDGTQVQVWVLKPPGFDADKKYPAVLEIHGGPHTQYGEAFFHEFQCLASAGYVVVYSNPRGSKGYGEQHCRAIKGNWGQADWIDVQAVMGFMQQQPWIRTKHMGVMGGSYGGYMTNWVIGHTKAFRAAITDRCVANLVSMVGSSDLPLVPGEYWDGNSWDKSESLWAQSPLKYFGEVETPTLIIHSEGDLRCNVEQGEQVFAALQLRGVPSKFVRYPHTTSHGFSRGGPPDLRIHRLREILAWWGRWLG